MTTLTIVGATSAAALSACIAPQTVRVIRHGTLGTSVAFMALWFLGASLDIVYLIGTGAGWPPLLARSTAFVLLVTFFIRLAWERLVRT